MSKASDSYCKTLARTAGKALRWPFRVIGKIAADRLVAYGTFVVAAATFALAFVAHNTDEKVGRQLTALERQLALMDSDQRPWVHLNSISLSSSFLVTENDARITVEFTLKNSGKSPAHLVRSILFLIGLVQKDGRTDLNRYWASCDDMKSKRASELSGLVIFPGLEAGATHFLSMDQANLAEWKNNPTGAALILGCTDYMYADFSTHHQSRFVFGLARKGANGLPISPLEPKLGEIPASDLKLIDTPGLFKGAD